MKCHNVFKEIHESTFGDFKGSKILCQIINENKDIYLKRIINKKIQALILELQNVREISDRSTHCSLLKYIRKHYLDNIKQNKRIPEKYKTFINSTIVTLIREELRKIKL